MTDVIEKEETDVRTRFDKVLAARKTGKDLITLLDKLADSTKFTDAEKPVCFGMLVKTAAERVAASEALSLLAAARRCEALVQVRTGYAMEDAEVIAAALVRRVMTAVPMERDSLESAVEALIKAKVAVDRGQVFGFASLSGMEPDTLDAMCDLIQ